MSNTISPSDPVVILAGIKQFGLAPDGSDLRELEASIRQLSAALQKAFVAMKVAAALPGVQSEYDFGEAIASAEKALASRRG